MKAFLVSIFLGVCSLCVHAQQRDLRWGEFGYYSNWKRYSYAIESEYEFISRLPDLREFPKLLEAALEPKMTRSDQAIILSQMRTLSRCDFVKTALQEGGDVDVGHKVAIAKWKDWWSHYGVELARSLPESGRREEKAWKEIAPSPYLECPDYPIAVPKAWSSTFSFRSGDYGGVTEEVIEFCIDEETCELRRRYRTGWLGETEWTHEVWTDFSREEASHFMAALIYAIDNPWFYGDDELSEASTKDVSEISHIRGRPKAWTDYYPSYEWTGILDKDQKVIINHDPWTWDSMDHKLGSKVSLDGGAFGLVFRVVRDLFPDPSWIPSESRWKKVDPPKKAPETVPETR